MDLRNKIALVSGASRGIGLFIVRALADQGTVVAGIARSKEGLESTSDIIAAQGGKFISIPFDLNEVDRLDEVVQKVKTDVGPIDILINNAGIESYQFYQNNSKDRLHSILTVNLHAPLELTRLVLPNMLERGGYIVSISSLAGKKGIAYNSIYSATKAGLITWTDALRQELAGTGVGISVICPGYISDAGMFHDGGADPPPLLGTSKPQEVASAVVEAITMGKSEIIVNKGPMKPLLAINQLSPTFGDKVVKWFGVPALSQKLIQKK